MATGLLLWEAVYGSLGVRQRSLGVRQRSLRSCRLNAVCFQQSHQTLAPAMFNLN